METSIYGHLNEEPQKNWLSHVAQRRSLLEKQLQVVQQRCVLLQLAMNAMNLLVDSTSLSFAL